MKWLSAVFFLFSVQTAFAGDVNGADAAAIQAQLEGLKKGVVKPVKLENKNPPQSVSKPSFGADIHISDDIFPMSTPSPVGSNISVVDSAFEPSSPPGVGNSSNIPSKVGAAVQNQNPSLPSPPSFAPADALASPGKKPDEQKDDLIAKCNMSGDLSMMLSPECLNFMKPAFNPARPQNPPSASSSSARRTSSSDYLCNVAVFMGETGYSIEFKPQTSTSISFRAPTLAQCIVNGSRMGFGHQGITNITAINDGGDNIFVSCRRTGANGSVIQCKQER